MEDQKIIELFFQRSEEALREVSNKYDGICKKISYNILNNIQDVEECVNDTYLVAWNNIPPNQPSPLVTYLCKIARNVSLKKLRYNTAQKRNSYYEMSLSELEECIPSGNSIYAEEKELTQVIEDFLVSLDKKSRVMFLRRYWFADSISDIAEKFCMKENNVSVKLMRIRKKLKKILE